MSEHYAEQCLFSEVGVVHILFPPLGSVIQVFPHNGSRVTFQNVVYMKCGSDNGQRLGYWSYKIIVNDGGNEIPA
jgi:hypothetical protein